MFTPEPEHGPLYVDTDYRAPRLSGQAATLYSSASLFDDALGCVRCASHTDHGARQCPVCGQTLWLRDRQVPRIRPAYRLFFVNAGSLIFFGLLLPFLLLIYVSMQSEIANLATVWQVYMGQFASDVTGVQLILDILSPTLFQLSLPLAGGALLLTLCVASRWSPLFFVALALCGLLLFAGTMSLLLGLFGHITVVTQDVPGAVFAGTAGRTLRFGILSAYLTFVVLSTLTLKLLLNIQDHFVITEQRLFLQLDHNTERTAASFWMHGRAYIKQGWWAMGALHLRYSLALDERLEAYLQLALAYSRLGHAELAKNTLRDAERFSPGNPQVARLMELLEA